jgi:hypothetical protein
MISAQPSDFASPEAVIVMLAAISVMFIVLSGLIGFVMRNFTKSFDEFRKAVQSMEVAIVELRGKNENIKTICETHSTTVDKRLNKHSDMLHDHATRITVLEDKKSSRKYTYKQIDNEKDT